MFLELSKNEIKDKLKNKYFVFDNKTLYDIINITYNNTTNFIETLIKGIITGFETKDEIGQINPLIWELGHVAFFWLHKTIFLIDTELFEKTELYEKYIHITNINISRDLFYSFFISRKKIFVIKLLNS